MVRRFTLLAMLLVSLLVAACQGRLNTIEVTSPATQLTQQAMRPTQVTPEPPPTNVMPATETAQPTQAPPTAVPATDTARPSDTPEPTDTPRPSEMPAEIPLPTDTPVPLTEIAETQAAQLAQALEETLAAQPSETPYPTYTPFASSTPYPTYTSEPSDTPEPTETATRVPSVAPSETATLVPTIDAVATSRAERTEQAGLMQIVEASLEARPSQTPYPTYTPLATYSPEPSDTPYPTYTLYPSDTPAATATPEPSETPAPTVTPTNPGADRTATAQAQAQIAEAIEQTLTALPTDTAIPSETPDAAATREAQQTQAAVNAAAVQATVEALPSSTPYPTYTMPPTGSPPPSDTPTLSPSATATPTRYVTPTAEARVTNQFETQVAAAVEETLAVLPTEPAITVIVVTETPEPSATSTLSPTPAPLSPLLATMTQTFFEMTQVALVSPTPSATRTPRPTDTPTPVPSPTPTPVPPTAAITVAPPTQAPDYFATATAAAQQVTMASPVPDIAEPTGPGMTATHIVQMATETAAAWMTLTATPTLPPTWTMTFTAAPAVEPTRDYAATATAIMDQATAVAQALDELPPNIAFDVPDGWREPERLDANTVYLTDGTAQVFIYRGDAAFFEQNWGIAAGETDLLAAAESLAAGVDGEVLSFDGKAAVPVLAPARNGVQGVLYLAQVAGGEWLILSGSAPEDDLAGYQADAFEPILLSLEITGPALPPALSVPTLTPSPTVLPSFTPTPAPPTLNPYLMTATQFAAELTMTATLHVTPSRTPAPSLTPSLTPSPTFTWTPTPDFDQTATAIVEQVTATAEAREAVPPDMTFEVPEGWGDPERLDDNTIRLTDGTAQAFIYRGDAAFFEQRFGIPADETDLLAAAEAVAAHLGGDVGSFEGQAAIPVLLPASGDRQGVVYLAQLEGGEWLILSGSAPVDDLDGYREGAFEPILLSLEVTHSGSLSPETTPVPPLTLEPYTSADLGLSFDVPAGWTEVVDEELNQPDQGLIGVVFFSDPADASSPGDTPKAPALAVVRIIPSLADLGSTIETPEDILRTLVIPAEVVQPVTGLAFRGARTVLEEEYQSGVVYAFDLGPDNWLLVVLIVPVSENILWWDEAVLLPVLRSITPDEAE